MTRSAGLGHFGFLGVFAGDSFGCCCGEGVRGDANSEELEEAAGEFCWGIRSERTRGAAVGFAVDILVAGMECWPPPSWPGLSPLWWRRATSS